MYRGAHTTDHKTSFLAYWTSFFALSCRRSSWLWKLECRKVKSVLDTRTVYARPWHSWDRESNEERNRKIAPEQFAWRWALKSWIPIICMTLTSFRTYPNFLHDIDGTAGYLLYPSHSHDVYQSSPEPQWFVSRWPLLYPNHSHDVYKSSPEPQWFSSLEPDSFHMTFTSHPLNPNQSHDVDCWRPSLSEDKKW